MKNSDYYHGKDFVHEGSLLILNKKQAWKKISSYTRRNIKRAEKFNFEIKRAKGTNREMHLLKSIWHDPKDPFLPKKLAKKDIMYVAYFEGKFIAAMVLIPSGNNLYLNNLAATDEGKRKYITNLLLWKAVEELEHSKYKYIDIGVSFRKNLQIYFNHWQTESYPIIFEPPKVLSKINFFPFNNSYMATFKRAEFDSDFLIEYFGTDFTIFPSVIECKQVAKRDNGKVEEYYWIEKNGKTKKYKIYDLTKIFPIQYGAIFEGVKISDDENWHKYKLLDYYKRELIIKLLKKYLPKIKIYKIRADKNFKYLEKLFSKEGLHVIPQNENSPLILWVKLKNNDYLKKRYALFGVETEVKNGKIGFPIHYNLTKENLRYIYAIFRGTLNLYSSYKRGIHAK